MGNQTKQKTNSLEDLMSTVKKRNLKWYGHVRRDNIFSNAMVYGIDLHKRRKGRHKKWIDVAVCSERSFTGGQTLAYNPDIWRE